MLPQKLEYPLLVPTPLSVTCPSWGTVAATYCSQTCKKETIVTTKKTGTLPFSRRPTPILVCPESNPAPLDLSLPATPATPFSSQGGPSLTLPSCSFTHTSLSPPPQSVGCPGHCVTQETAQTEASSRPRRKKGGRGRGGGLAWPQTL